MEDRRPQRLASKREAIVRTELRLDARALGREAVPESDVARLSGASGSRSWISTVRATSPRGASDLGLVLELLLFVVDRAEHGTLREQQPEPPELCVTCVVQRRSRRTVADALRRLERDVDPEARDLDVGELALVRDELAIGRVVTDELTGARGDGAPRRRGLAS